MCRIHLILGLMIILLSGCRQFARDVAADATPVGAEATLEQLSDPQNRELLAQMARELSTGVAQGAADELAPPVEQAGVDADPTLPRAVSREVSLGIRDALVDVGVLTEEGRVSPAITGRAYFGLSAAALIAVILGGIGLALLTWLILVIRAKPVGQSGDGARDGGGARGSIGACGRS